MSKDVAEHQIRKDCVEINWDEDFLLSNFVDKLIEDKDVDNYNNCRDVAWAIGQRSDRSDEGFEIFKQWVSTSPKYTLEWAKNIYFQRSSTDSTPTEEIKREARERLKAAKLPVAKSPYFSEAKNFSPEDIALLGSDIGVDEFGNTVFGHLCEKSGDLIGTETISPDGKRKRTQGKKGVFFINKCAPDGSIVYVVEGPATGISTFMASKYKHPVISTSGSTGLGKGVEAASLKYPDATIFVLGDAGKGGEKAARKAAKTNTRAISIIAKYPVGETPDNTDFNDIHAKFGLEAVAKQLEVCKRASRQLHLVRFDQLPEIQPPDWLVKPFLTRGALCGIIAPPATYKTFIALGLSLSMCAGISCYGFKITKKCSVVLVVGEGGSGIPIRIEGWLKHHGINKKDVDIYISNKSASLYENPEELVDLLDELDKVDVVIVDTLSRNTPGMEENSSKEMAIFVKAIDDINHRFNCSTIVIQHTPHTNKKRARGSTVLHAATDIEYLLERCNSSANGLSDVRLSCTKMKDHNEMNPLILTPAVVDLDDKDEEGSPLTTLVFEENSTFEISHHKVRGANQDALFRAIRNQHDNGDGWKDLVKAHADSGLNSKRKNEVTQSLIKNGVIQVEGKLCRLL